MKSARVCSHHFVDDAPTENPYPTENLGYDSKRKVSNVLNFSSTPKPGRKRAKLHHNPISNIDSDIIDHAIPIFLIQVYLQILMMMLINFYFRQII